MKTAVIDSQAAPMSSAARMFKGSADQVMPASRPLNARYASQRVVVPSRWFNVTRSPSQRRLLDGRTGPL
jgi:hypothetical protein